MNKIKVWLTISLLIVLYSTILGEQKHYTNYITNRLAVGLNYPGVALKYGFANNFAVDLRYQTNNTSYSFGSRGYLYLTPISSFIIFLGGEYDYINYKSDKVDSAGGYYAGFVGVEYFLAPAVSVYTDIGYGQMSLKDKNVETNVTTDPTVMNIGLNLYLGNPKNVAAEQLAATTTARMKEKKVETSSTATTEKINIAVSEFSGRNVSDMSAMVVADFVREVLSKDERFVVVDRGNMAKVLADQRVQMTGCTTSECAIKLGRLLNVEKIVVGSLAKLESVYYVGITMTDVETGKVEFSGSTKCFSDSELDTVTRTLTRQMTENIKK